MADGRRQYDVWYDLANRVQRWRIHTDPVTDTLWNRLCGRRFCASAQGLLDEREICSTALFYGKTREEALSKVYQLICANTNQRETIELTPAEVCVQNEERV